MADTLLKTLFIALIMLPLINSIKKCPIECSCDLDESGRYSAICEKGNMTFHDSRNHFQKLFIDFHIQT